jgi:hypothetical protein
MTLEKTIHTNGFKPRSWGDLAALAAIVTPILALCMALVLWGLKLEQELNDERNARVHLERRVSDNKGKIDQGILGIARTEIDNIKERDAAILKRVERLEEKH